MSKGGVLTAEEALETGANLAKKAGKGIAKSASDTAKAATSQLGISQTTDQSTQDFVKDLYGAGKKNPQAGGDSSSNPAQSPTQPVPSDTESPKSPEEQQKLAEVRTKLQKRHDEFYYEPLVNPKGEKPEERPAEKVENEKQQEMVDLQKKEKDKPPPLAVQRGQRKTEQFPGGGG
ncbi:MAG: hypothetical protein AAB531_02235 [Patescibacteria group bacterium]